MDIISDLEGMHSVMGRNSYSFTFSCVEFSHSSVEQSSITRHCRPPLSPSSAVVLNHISSHFLILLSESSLISAVPAPLVTHDFAQSLLHLTFNI